MSMTSASVASGESDEDSSRYAHRVVWSWHWVQVGRRPSHCIREVSLAHFAKPSASSTLILRLRQELHATATPTRRLLGSNGSGELRSGTRLPAAAGLRGRYRRSMLVLDVDRS